MFVFFWSLFVIASIVLAVVAIARTGPLWVAIWVVGCLAGGMGMGLRDGFPRLRPLPGEP
jgi:uncharacterized membrane protein